MRKVAYFLLIGLISLAFGAVSNVYAHQGHSETMQNLKDLGVDKIVASLNHCNGMYTIVMESGAKHEFKEFDLRFKVDTSNLGPKSGKPVLISAGMGSDRGFVVFASIADLKVLPQENCKK